MFLKTQQIPKATIVKNKKRECVNRQIQHHEHKCVYQERMIYGTEKKEKFAREYICSQQMVSRDS